MNLSSVNVEKGKMLDRIQLIGGEIFFSELNYVFMPKMPCPLLQIAGYFHLCLMLEDILNSSPFPF